MQTLVPLALVLVWWWAFRPRRVDALRNFDQGMRALARIARRHDS